MKIAIMTDVNAGLDYVPHSKDIVILRSTVNFGNEILVDGKDITAEEFYNRIQKVQTREDIPSTSAPALGDIYDAFDRFIELGYTHVIHFPISFELSGTGKNVVQVAEEYKDKLEVTVVNTKTACYMQGYLALNAYNMAQQGLPYDEIVKRSLELADQTNIYFAVQNLDYLVKNGRLSGASGFVGTLLKIKPILEITPEGKITTKEKVKTSKRALQRLVELAIEAMGDHQNCIVVVLHSLAKEDAEYIKNELINQKPELGEIDIQFVAPAVGAHVGCGVSGVGIIRL